jgi:ABC-type nitrate/sulfonate/bicarbonate transport system substrate-binding protein
MHMAGQPKAPFYFVVFLVVAALIGVAVWRADIFAPPGDGGGGEPGDPIQPMPSAAQAETPDSAGITTVKEYEFVPSQKLKPVEGTSDYQPLADGTVRFALNVWAGWAPIIHANGGHRPEKVWKTPDGKDFKLELVLMDDPTSMLDSYASGNVHIGWATLDMLPLFMQRLVDVSGKIQDSRVMPRVYQQVDWSNGGDGIVVRGSIPEVKDLRKKKIVLAENSPSQYFLLNMLVSAGIQPQSRDEVEFLYTNDAFEAAAAFNADRSIDACVSWAPDIYNLEKVAGNRILVSTSTANRLIADVWFARADFARDHPGICEALVRGIFDAMDELKSDEAKQSCAAKMAEFYNIAADEAMSMFADAYSTGWGDNYQFFLNRNYLANFERVWNNAYYLYGRMRAISHPRIPFDEVMDFTFIRKLGEEDKYRAQQAQRPTFDYRDISQQEVAEKAFLTTTHYIHFYPNSYDLYRRIVRTEADGQQVEGWYDPGVEIVLNKIGEQIGQFELSRIVIEGHTDSSMEGQVDEQLVLELSRNRANAVKDELVTKHGLDPNRFTVVGMGWKRPANPEDPLNHAQNRRVEVRILPAEGQ